MYKLYIYINMEKEQKKNLNKIDSSQKLAKLIKENTCVIIKISASWCGPCKNKEFLNNYHGLKDKFSSYNNIKFVELDIDENSDMIEDKSYYNIEINSVPTFMIAKNGNFTRKYEGTSHLGFIYKYLSESV